MLEATQNPQKMDLLISFLVDETFKKGFIYLTHDHTGVALWSTSHKEKLSLNLVQRYLKLMFSLSPKTLWRLLKFERITYQQMAASQDYLYLANIAVLPEAQGKGKGSLLLNPVLDYCAKNELPVFLETANHHNVALYKRKGFTINEVVDYKALQFYCMQFN